MDNKSRLENERTKELKQELYQLRLEQYYLSRTKEATQEQISNNLLRIKSTRRAIAREKLAIMEQENDSKIWNNRSGRSNGRMASSQ